MKKVEDMTILRNEKIARDVYEMVVEGHLVALMETPGKFVHIKVDASNEHLLRRPISICAVDQAKKTLTMIYRIEGEGTRIMSEKKPGETLNILGPLGQGYPLDRPKETALLIGGGIGIPPLYELAKQLSKKGTTVITVLGVASKEDLFYEREFKAFGEVYVATVDGSYGYKGNVLELIQENGLRFDAIYGCGPTPMLRAIADTFPEYPGYLSYEERMGCGIGACYACVCKKKDRSQVRVCKEGPVFVLGEVL